MSTDDIIYISLLVSCILFGQLYRTVLDATSAKRLGTAFGLLIVCVVSGWHALHILLSTGACAAIILHVDKRKSHLVAFVFMFAYLFFFRTTDYFGIPLPSGHTNMIQMMVTLKLVGLAFEVNTAHTNAKLAAKPHPTTTVDDASSAALAATSAAEQQMFSRLGYADIFHYAFNYIGVLTGPYYRYRTFHDYFALPFKQLADCTGATVRKFAWVPLFAAAYLLVSHQWPLSYATSDEFYTQRSVLYRLWYVWPTFFIFRMRIYIGITLSECVCTMAGFGAYPASAAATAGGGPRPGSNYAQTIEVPTAIVEPYDFETIHNIDAYTTDTCWTFREAMKSWNMCVQYWLAVNVYKRFPSKAYRVLATLLVSAVWHGVYSGYYFCILGVPFYLPIEDTWHKLLRKDASASSSSWKTTAINVLFWVSKFFAFSYMGIAFLLLSLDKIWFYYSSVYHLGYVYFAVMFAVGQFWLRQRRVAAKRAAKREAEGSGVKKEN